MGSGHRCWAGPDLRLETDPGRHPAPDSGCDALRERAPGRWAPALRLPPQWQLGVLHSGRSVTIIFWLFDPATGGLSQQQQISSLPPGFIGTDFTSEIRVSADGRFVYGANRLSDTISVFRVDPDGMLNQVSHASTLGDYPRIFTIDPFGGLWWVVISEPTTLPLSGSPIDVEMRDADRLTMYRMNLRDPVTLKGKMAR